MNKPLISIIVTCYNQKATISQALISVKNQTYAHWECIIVDDGSTDCSDVVIKQTVGSDQRFQYHYQDNQGVAKARNTGFALAKGEYINFLDGDDTFHPEKLEQQLKVFEDHPDVSICICDHQHYLAEKNKYAYYEYDLLKSDPLKQLLYKWQLSVAFPQHAPIYRRKIWSSSELPYPLNYNQRSEDWVFNVMVALKREPYYFLSKVLCTYHHYGSNFTTDVLESAVSAIHAARYLEPHLPELYQRDFLDFTVRKSIKRYTESQKPLILRSSGNWRLGNLLTRPFFKLKKILATTSEGSSQ
jgi:glycosyltransferase involved in cell wall biosynthesis